MADPIRLDWFYRQIGDKVVELVKSNVDANFPTGTSPDSHRYKACVEAGKALVLTGMSFIGNGLGINDPNRCLPPIREAFSGFQKRCEEIVAQLEKGN